jgi:hypothetical protein
MTWGLLDNHHEKNHSFWKMLVAPTGAGIALFDHTTASAWRIVNQLQEE